MSWQVIANREWGSIILRADRSHLEQSAHYGSAVARTHGMENRTLLFKDGAQVLCGVQIFDKHIGSVLRYSQLLMGPVWLQRPSEAQWAVFAAELRQAHRLQNRRFLVWSPPAEADGRLLEVIRSAGWRQVFTGASTVEVDLAAECGELRARLHPKWRNALVQSEHRGTEIRDMTRGEIAELIERAEKKRHSLRYRGPGGPFLRNLTNIAERAVALGAYRAGRLIGGALFQSHGSRATYLLAHLDKEGRENGAGNLLLWRGMLQLKRVGIRSLDLGGVDTRRVPGLARFKLGLGGRPYTMIGTFV